MEMVENKCIIVVIINVLFNKFNLKVMKVEVKKVFDVKSCNDCPYMKTYVDASVCYDTFDEPNYEWYCSKEGHWGRRGLGKLIGIGLSSFRKCDIIPVWCPCKNK